MLVIGTRPDAIKMAPVALECLRRPGLAPIVCSTDQHPRLVDGVARFFGFEIERRLSVFEPRQSPGRLLGRATAALAEAIEQARPDWVVAAGDTATVAAAACAAFLQGTRFVHIEAGLRSGRLDAPWPEEFNRRLATLAAAWHCAPTEPDRRRLVAEGVDASRIIVCGNTIVDALVWTVERLRNDERRRREFAERFGAARRPRVIVTCHRRESHGPPARRMLDAIRQLARRDLEIVFPIHPNPDIAVPAHEMLGSEPGIHLTEPLEYPDFVWLMSTAAVLLTDSGGIQEEACSLGVPVVVMREVTEREAGVARGLARLAGTHSDEIVAAVLAAADHVPRGIDPPLLDNPYGDGHAAQRIVNTLLGSGSDGPGGPSRDGRSSCESP